MDALDLTIYDGRVEDFILSSTSDDFGIQTVHILIQDDQGNVIERGEALDVNDGFGTWCYFVEVPVPSGTPVIVHASACDCLGGVGAQRATKIIH